MSDFALTKVERMSVLLAMATFISDQALLTPELFTMEDIKVVEDTIRDYTVELREHEKLPLPERAKKAKEAIISATLKLRAVVPTP